MPKAPNRDGFGLADNCNPASVDYFVEIFGYQEAIELSKIDDPTSNTINNQKIQVALNDAAALINNYILTAPPQGKILIAGSYRRTQAIIARWYLDTLRPRQQVIDAAKGALEQLELWAAKGNPSAALKWQEAYGYWGVGCSMVRSSSQRRRSFTEPSLTRWVLREGGNNRWWRAGRKEAHTAITGVSSPLNSDSRVTDEMPESILEVNKLFDALETTRDLGSFANTQDAVDPEGGDALIANNEAPSEDGSFDNFGGLLESDTF